jgi:hypothetical protein
VNCLQCRRPLESADKLHRYCPYCGAIRAIGADSDLLLCGEETLSNYKVYGYSSLNALPGELDPVTGSSERDLVASSGSPYPWQALRTTVAAGPTAELNLETPLHSVELRHRRLYCSTVNGQLFGLHAQSLKQATLREVLPNQDFVVGDTLLHLVSPGPGGTNWTACPLTRGVDPLFDVRLPIREARLAVHRSHFAALGPDELCWGSLNQPEDFRRARLAVSSAGEPGRPFLLGHGGDWLIVARDGKVYRQSLDDPDQSEPENVFANPNRLKVLQLCTTATGEVRLLARSTGGPRSGHLLSVGGSVRHLQLAEREGELRMTTLPQGSFVAIKPVGLPIEVHCVAAEEQLVMTLPGSIQHDLEGLYPFPGETGWDLMLATKRDGHWELWKVELPTGNFKQLQGQEPSHHQLSFPWEAGRACYVNLTTGRIRELA